MIYYLSIVDGDQENTKSVYSISIVTKISFVIFINILTIFTFSWYRRAATFWIPGVTWDPRITPATAEVATRENIFKFNPSDYQF